MKLKKYLLPVIFCVISNVAFGKALVFKSLEVERLENQNQNQAQQVMQQNPVLHQQKAQKKLI